MAKEQNLAHTKWLCRYHIVFTPKYRRKEKISCLIRGRVRNIRIRPIGAGYESKYMGFELLKKTGRRTEKFKPVPLRRQ